MGSKGGSMVAPPNYIAPVDNSMEFQNSLQQYEMQSQQMLQQSQFQFENQLRELQSNNEEYTSKLPTLLGTDAANVDWEKQSQELKDKMEAQYAADEARKKGRSSTILTSPLLDSEDPSTSRSILTGN